jgi:hypothetical protein
LLSIVDLGWCFSYEDAAIMPAEAVMAGHRTR